MGQKIANLPHYRYKLHEENCLKKFKRTKPLITMQLSGINLYTDRWVTSQNPVQGLKPYLKNKDNPDGIVDWEEYIPGEGKVTETSEGKVKSESKIEKEVSPILGESTPLQSYTIEELTVMSREELVDVGEKLGLKVKHIRNDKLIKNILSKQIENT